MVSKLKLKLFYKKKSGRVLFAVVEKDFVDFLLNHLTYPVDLFADSGSNNPKLGCIRNLYVSFNKILEDYSTKTGKRGSILLNPTTPFGRFLKGDANSNSMKFYTCSDGKCRLCFTEVRGARCPKCKRTMTTACTYVVNHGAGSSSMRDGYAVMDNFVLKPQRENPTVRLLQACAINKLDEIGESHVEVTKDEVLDMLKASLKSSTVLTDKFSHGKKQKAEKKAEKEAQKKA